MASARRRVAKSMDLEKRRKNRDETKLIFEGTSGLQSAELMKNETKKWGTPTPPAQRSGGEQK